MICDNLGDIFIILIFPFTVLEKLDVELGFVPFDIMSIFRSPIPSLRVQ